jgi:hypothetical protein
MDEPESRWSKEHIDKTIEIIKRVKEQKPKHIKFLDKSIYWVILLITIVGNFIISIPILLLLFVLEPFQLYPVVIFLGVAFGLLIEILIRDLEHLEQKHHLIFGLIIPVIALINFFIITQVVDNLKLDGKFSPLVVGLVYAVSFILPYIYYQVIKKKDTKLF